MQNPYLSLQKNGQEESNIKSREGRYDIKNHLIFMSGDVIGNSLKENARIETEKIFYDTETKKVWVNTDVTIVRAGVTVEGKGLKADSDFSEIEIFRQKTAVPRNIEDFEAAAK
jgi:LPS export ABC transporter protein LptC